MRDAHLRELLLGTLRRTGAVRSARVAAAIRTVPRHRFLPGLSLPEAYADRAVAIKMEDDEILSSISQPGMIAQMLELLDPAPGDRVLEIGTGSGYNAALLAEMVGPGGTVTSIELDAELAESAKAALREVGYHNVRVVAGDGSSYPLGATQFDRVIVTARCEDLAGAWWDALREGARIVAPLRLQGAGEYAVGFERRGDRLVSIGAHPCAFIAIRGEAGAATAGDVFYRDPSARNVATCVRRVTGVVAVRREHAVPELLDRADVVIARPTTVFAVTFE